MNTLHVNLIYFIAQADGKVTQTHSETDYKSPIQFTKIIPDKSQALKHFHFEHLKFAA